MEHSKQTRVEYKNTNYTTENLTEFPIRNSLRFTCMLEVGYRRDTCCGNNSTQ